MFCFLFCLTGETEILEAGGELSFISIVRCKIGILQALGKERKRESQGKGEEKSMGKEKEREVGRIEITLRALNP